MDVIMLDSNMRELYHTKKPTFDFEVGNEDVSNDVEITDLPSGVYALYVPGTEWGGVVEYSKVSASSDKSKAWTWRGLLTQMIIEPPSGADYLYGSGDANDIIYSLVTPYLGGFFKVPTGSDGNTKKSGITINNYQFDRYCKTLTGLMDMLSDYDARLYIHADKVPDSYGGHVEVYVEAVQRTTVDGQIDDTSRMSLTYTEDNMGINHLVCMGKGDLKDRERLDLYLQQDGSVGTTKYYTGFLERTQYYDYGSAQDTADLKKNGTKRLLEVAPSKTIDVSDVSQDMEVGDLVRCGYTEKGITFTAPIYKKILKISNGVATTEYKVKGNT